ncbi:MAG: leucyl aminopeptidase [Chlamydiae bacterium]|nr:leucyl aminopeptidase [Chlamydiota bacterium]MBI3267358.1 leucyl aminopeptidase [Chlamydiota bacterium]
MQIECVSTKESAIKECDAIILGVTEGKKDLGFLRDFLSENLVKRIEKYFTRAGAPIRKNDILSFDGDGQIIYTVVLSKEPSMENIRQACGHTVDFVCGQVHRNVAVLADSFGTKEGNLTDRVEAMAEVIDLALYRFDPFKPKDQKRKDLKTCQFIFRDGKDVTKALKAVEIGRTVSESVNFTRDLVNTPSNELPPRVLADRASQMAKECNISIKIYDEKELQKMKMGGILAVSQGSVQEPRMIVLEYGDPKKPVDFAFVGKGVTFDSGGISIKPSDGMEKMKYDMAGGAAVLGILRTAAKLSLDVHIVGIVPAAENMPSGAAYRPGDVIWMGSGKSVEVLNTDAEGRLLLGDGLFLAERYKPKMVVDLATLTGACVVALGTVVVAVLGNDPKVILKIKEAGELSGERVWELPLWDDYFDQIKSDVAEIKNVGGKGGGTITAAMFLKQFVNYPWAHLDIAGTAWAEEKKPYFQKGATGVGVRLLTKMMRKQ